MSLSDGLLSVSVQPTGPTEDWGKQFLPILRVGILDCISAGQRTERWRRKANLCHTRPAAALKTVFLLFFNISEAAPCLCHPRSLQQGEKKKSPHINPHYQIYFLVCCCSSGSGHLTSATTGKGSSHFVPQCSMNVMDAAELPPKCCSGGGKWLMEAFQKSLVDRRQVLKVAWFDVGGLGKIILWWINSPSQNQAVFPAVPSTFLWWCRGSGYEWPEQRPSPSTGTRHHRPGSLQMTFCPLRPSSSNSKTWAEELEGKAPRTQKSSLLSCLDFIVQAAEHPVCDSL